MSVHIQALQSRVNAPKRFTGLLGLDSVQNFCKSLIQYGNTLMHSVVDRISHVLLPINPRDQCTIVRTNDYP
jgi:hypothetical protein